MDPETEFYMRILLLLFKAGPLVCRGIVDRELTGARLDQILQTHEQRLKDKLLKSQYFMLFPRNGIPNPSDFDLSLLTVVLLDVFNISRDERLEVENIKKIRNDLIHVYGMNASLDQGTYNYMQHMLQEAFTKLSANLGAKPQQQCKELIRRYLSEPLDQEAALQNIKGIRNEDEILQQVQYLLEEQTRTFTKMIEESEKRMTTKLENIKQEHELLDGMIRTMKGYHGDQERSNSAENGESKHLPLCEICLQFDKSMKSKYICHTCKQLLCGDCYQTSHVKSLLLRMKNHHIQNTSGYCKVDMKGMDVCKIHSASYKRFCKQHDLLCCDRCVSERHSNCQNVVDITQIAEGSPNSMLNPVAEIERLQESTTSMDQWMGNYQERLDNCIGNIPAVLQENRTKMVVLYDRKASVVTNKANKYQKEITELVQKNRKQCSSLLDETEEVKRALIRIASTGTPVQKFTAYQHFRSKIKVFETDFSLIRNMYKSSPDFTDIKIFEEIAQDLGRVSLKIPNMDNDY